MSQPVSGPFEEGGGDSEGRNYKSINDMWKFELGNDAGAETADTAGSKMKWYTTGDTYWKKVEPTDNGMLGGFEKLSDLDVKDSSAFLQQFLRKQSRGKGPNVHISARYACGACSTRC